MKFFSNRNADDRVLIFLTFAVGYVILVELVSARRGRARAALGGVAMSASVLFDAPGPRTRARHRLYSALGLLLLAALAAAVILRFVDRGQFEYRLWEPLVTPEFDRALLVDGLLQDAADGGALHPLRGRLRPPVRRREAVRARVAALAELAGRGVLPGRCPCC